MFICNVYAIFAIRLTINDENIDKDIKVVYTPLNGVGNLPVREVLKPICYEDHKLMVLCQSNYIKTFLNGHFKSFNIIGLTKHH